MIASDAKIEMLRNRDKIWQASNHIYDSLMRVILSMVKEGKSYRKFNWTVDKNQGSEFDIAINALIYVGYEVHGHSFIVTEDENFNTYDLEIIIPREL